MSEQVWFITGSSRGPGRAVAEEALAAGNRVAVTARNTGALADLKARYGDRALPLALDVTEPAQAERTVKATVAEFGRLDVVVNNAGYANMVPVEDISLDDFRAQVDAVFYGTVYVTKAALPVFLEQGSGHFIQVTSTGGRLTAPGLSAYQSAKHSVEGFSQVLAKEVDGLGVKVTLAEPGAMRTDWAGSSMETPTVKPNYAPTVGALIDQVRETTGQEPIDPVKVARAFVDIARMDRPPLRLVLGRAAVDYLAADLTQQLADHEKWAGIGRSVDFD
jgi:NAD(P)-dependent dehydrogenase (short-subunit alcohol dehydrogenase family)